MSKCTLIVVRNNMSNSKPCKRCLELIRNYGIKKVYYSDEKKLVFEKSGQMKTNHLSAKYKSPWAEFFKIRQLNQEENRLNNKKQK